MRFNFAPGSSISYGDTGAAGPVRIPFERTARLIESASHVSEIVFNEGRVSGFPVFLQPSAQLNCVLKIDVPKDVKPGESIKLQLIQRMSNGNIAGGITIVINVRQKK
jgi:hypothetical protein